MPLPLPVGNKYYIFKKYLRFQPYRGLLKSVGKNQWEIYIKSASSFMQNIMCIILLHLDDWYSAGNPQ